MSVIFHGSDGDRQKTSSEPSKKNSRQMSPHAYKFQRNKDGPTTWMEMCIVDS